jgi:hypothetical protein
MAIHPTSPLDFLSKSLLVKINIIIGKKANTERTVHKLFQNQNLVLFFSEAGSIWFAFFHNKEPGMKNNKSKPRQISKK